MIEASRAYQFNGQMVTLQDQIGGRLISTVSKHVVTEEKQAREDKKTMAITALHTAATGMQALSTKIDVIANNVANAETVGFKSSRANFQDLLYQVRSQPGVQTSTETSSPLGTQIGLGVVVSNTQMLFRQGSALQGTNLDAMIEGDGFFQVDLADGRAAYTRAGNFVINADGELVLGNSMGYRLKDSPTVPESVDVQKISVGSNGEITYIDETGAQQVAGQLELARFVNPADCFNTARTSISRAKLQAPRSPARPAKRDSVNSRAVISN